MTDMCATIWRLIFHSKSIDKISSVFFFRTWVVLYHYKSIDREGMNLLKTRSGIN